MSSSSNNHTAIATGIICSEYKQETDQFIFISKNSDIDSPENYHLNIYNNNNKTMLSPVPLLNIAHFPNATNLHFGGLCSYASSKSSFYLNFEESSTTKSTTTTTLIYQLQLDNATSLPLQFQKTPVEIFNSTLSSFVYAASSIANATSNLAYISTSTTTHQSSLNLVNLDHIRQQTAKNISSDLGLLAVGGTGSQSLYFIQNHAVDVYRLDSLQYSHTALHTNMTLEGLRRGTTGHVLSRNDKDYISFYHANSGQVDIFDIQPALVKYRAAAVSRSGYIDLSRTGAPVPAIRQSSNVSHLLSMMEEKEKHHKRDMMKPSNKRSLLKALSKKFYLKRGVATTALTKRAIDTSHDNMQTSSDGAISYHSSRVVPDNGASRLPQAALLVPATSNSNNAVYDYAVFSEDSANPNQFSVTTESTTEPQIPVIQTPTDTNAVLQDASAASHLGGGAIAGIVISVIAFIAIIAGLLLYSKKRKDRVYASNSSSSIHSRSMKPAMTTYNSGTPLAIQPDDVVGARYSGGAGGGGSEINHVDDNHTHTSSILQATTFIPEEYHDGSRPDIRPLSYSDETIDYAQLSSEELSQLEPDVQGPLFLFSGVYTSSAQERVTYLQDGYAIRTFDAKDGLKQTVHYFSAARLDTFVRSVHAVLRTSSRSSKRWSSLVSPTYVIRSERAIVLNAPTPHNHYQYIWITSPMLPEHSLHHLLFEQTKWTFIDCNNADYKIWSVYSLLKGVETLHSHHFVHLAIDPKAFYFDHEMKATDWKLGNLGYAKSIASSRHKGSNNNSSSSSHIVFPTHSAFTAPEIIQAKDNLQLDAADMWSLGCVIYTVATGGQVLFQDAEEVKRLAVFHDDMKQHLKAKIRQHVENQVFQTILERVLQVDPSERKHIKNVLDYWDSIYNMEE